MIFNNYCVSSNNDIMCAGIQYLLNSNHHYGIVMTVLYKKHGGSNLAMVFTKMGKGTKLECKILDVID